jgi:hypothetical protein
MLHRRNLKFMLLEPILEHSLGVRVGIRHGSEKSGQ